MAPISRVNEWATLVFAGNFDEIDAKPTSLPEHS